jgi:myo-inositol-1(or 4)-monophosphatase
MATMQEFLAPCEQAARLGGRELLRWQGKFQWREKSKKDLVTEADLASQQAIQAFVAAEFPDHDFLGEEDEGAVDFAGKQARKPFRWLVDPLDGTANYVHGLPNYAVSVAIEYAGNVVCGVVYDPNADECFAAARGQGATLNGKRVSVSGCQHLEEALVAASFAPNVRRGSPEIARFVEVLVRCQSMRRLGSAALNLCYVGAGRLDSYWATSVKIWDVAAGMLFVQEAGGTVTSMDGSPVSLAHPEMLASATSPLHAELLSVLKRAVEPQ